MRRGRGRRRKRKRSRRRRGSRRWRRKRNSEGRDGGREGGGRSEAGVDTMKLSAAAEMQVLASTQDSHKSANVHAYAHMRDGLLAAYILQHTNGIRSGI